MPRLIDADVLKAAFETDGYLSPYMQRMIDACPTVAIDCNSGCNWISVKDGLPEEGQLVAYIPTCNQGSVYIGNFYCVGKNGGVMFSHNEGRHRTNYYAKYWIPLPELPKEEEK